MKNNQEFSPKYWIVHNTLTDDVFLDTASKSYQQARINFHKKYGEYPDHDYIRIDLMEINKVM